MQSLQSAHKDRKGLISNYLCFTVFVHFLRTLREKGVVTHFLTVIREKSIDYTVNYTTY